MEVLAGIVACTSDVCKTGIAGMLANKGGVAAGCVCMCMCVCEFAINHRRLNKTDSAPKREIG
jgi:hypothetical protein